MASTDNKDLQVATDTKVDEVVNQLLQEQDVDKAKEILKLFNMNIAKKNAIRAVKLNDLLDKVNDQALARMEANPDEVSNKDLLGYMTAVQNQLDKTMIGANALTEVAPIQFNTQNNIVIAGQQAGPTLSKESRERVLAAVQQVLALANEDVVDAEVINKEDTENDK